MKIKGLIAYGDSIFFGYGASSRNLGCIKQLKAKLSIPLLIKAKNNVTTRDALSNLKDNILTYDVNSYSDVIILFGNNDSKLIAKDSPNVSREEYKDNLIKIISQIIASKRRCYISNLQPIEEKRFLHYAQQIRANMALIKSPYLWHKKYSDVCVEVSTLCNIPLIDIRTPLENSTINIFFDDGVHPNDLGHTIICNTIYEVLSQNMQFYK